MLARLDDLLTPCALRLRSGLVFCCRGGMVLLQSRIRRARAKKQAIELKAQADQQRKLEEQLQRLKAKLQEVRQRQLTGWPSISSPCR